MSSSVPRAPIYSPHLWLLGILLHRQKPLTIAKTDIPEPGEGYPGFTLQAVGDDIHITLFEEHLMDESEVRERDREYQRFFTGALRTLIQPFSLPKTLMTPRYIDNEHGVMHSIMSADNSVLDGGSDTVTLWVDLEGDTTP